MYEALIGYWNGACYETCERVSLDAEELDDAIEEVQNMYFGDEDYDIQVVIEDEDGDEVHTEYFENSVAQNEQNDMDETWEDEGEFSTDHLGVKDGKWFVWSSNGGSGGAYDRMDGSGRWIEIYEKPEEIGFFKALSWLVENANFDEDEALDEMENADNEHTKCDFVKEIGDCLWKEDDYIGLYRVKNNLYTVDITECQLVDEDEAADFIAKYDEEFELSF